MIIHEFDLDMIPDNAITTVKVNQYDDDFNLKINLFSRKGGLTIQAGTEVIIRGKKPDGHVFSADCSINGNVVTVVGNQQMTAAAGRAIFELSLRKNGKELNSANFIMKVERAPMDKDTPPSNSVIRELVDALDHTEEILEAAESVEEWLSTIDDTLSQPNKAADAKKTGDEIADLKSALSNFAPALLACFEKVAWIDNSGKSLYNDLKDAFGMLIKSRVSYLYPGDDNVTILSGATLNNYAENGITYLRMNDANNRSIIGFDEGDKPLLRLDNGSSTGLYPIPIPLGTTSISITFNSSNQNTTCMLRKVIEDGNEYRGNGSSAWLSSGGSWNFTNPISNESYIFAQMYANGQAFSINSLNITFEIEDDQS